MRTEDYTSEEPDALESAHRAIEEAANRRRQLHSTEQAAYDSLERILVPYGRDPSSWSEWKRV